MQRILSFLLLATLVGCTKNPSAEELIDQSVLAITKGESILNLVTEANCEGPKGKYTTTVQSDTSGYTYFKQTYEYLDTPLEAVIFGNSGLLVSNDSIITDLDKQIMTALKSHEFHMILLDMKNRFHQFGEPKYEAGQVKIAALDELNNPIEISLKKNSPQIQSIIMRNPGDTTERISWSYADWKLIQGIRLPMRVTILQGTDKTFTFDFAKVEVNSKDFKRWRE